MSNWIEEGMKEWTEQSKRLLDIFGPYVIAHRIFQRAKLAHYRDLFQRPKALISEAEKLTHSLLKAEIKRM